jgi:hypothetical protein
MSKKTLNKANLETLGPETLVALMIDLVQGNAARAWILASRRA